MNCYFLLSISFSKEDVPCSRQLLEKSSLGSLTFLATFFLLYSLVLPLPVVPATPMYSLSSFSPLALSCSPHFWPLVVLRVPSFLGSWAYCISTKLQHLFPISPQTPAFIPPWVQLLPKYSGVGREAQIKTDYLGLNLPITYCCVDTLCWTTWSRWWLHSQVTCKDQ